jgi:hypothetical protein
LEESQFERKVSLISLDEIIDIPSEEEGFEEEEKTARKTNEVMITSHVEEL